MKIRFGFNSSETSLTIVPKTNPIWTPAHTASSTNEFAKNTGIKFVTNKRQFSFRKSFTYFLQQFISTCLMLIFMTFNMYLILSITLGMATGYYLTGFIRIAHQLKLQDQDCCWYYTSTTLKLTFNLPTRVFTFLHSSKFYQIVTNLTFDFFRWRMWPTRRIWQPY